MRRSLIAALFLATAGCEGSVNNQDILVMTTARVSVGPAGVEGNGISDNAVVSEDGRYLVFQSNADTLVAGDTNLKTDVFRRDLLTGATEIASLANDESLGNARSETPAVSADGRYVAFQSRATNLVSPATAGGRFHVYRRDLQTGTTVLCSSDGAGVQGDMDSTQPAISPDGDFVAFRTWALNLGGTGSLAWSVVVLKDVPGTGTTLISGISTGGTAEVYGGQQPSVSQGGAYVAYLHWDVPAGAGLPDRLYIYRRPVPGVAPGVLVTAGANDWSDQPKLSRNGNLVLFRSYATNLTLDDRTGTDIFLRDMALAQTTLVSVDSAGSGDLGDAANPALSSDGRFIAFSSNAGNLVPGDTNLAVDVFVHDRVTGATVRASVRTFGQETPVGSVSTLPALPLGGAFVIFQSNAPTIVDLDNNGVDDVFLRTLSW